MCTINVGTLSSPTHGSTLTACHYGDKLVVRVKIGSCYSSKFPINALHLIIVTCAVHYLYKITIVPSLLVHCRFVLVTMVTIMLVIISIVSVLRKSPVSLLYTSKNLLSVFFIP